MAERASEVIRSRANPWLGRLRRVREDGGRDSGLALIEGVTLLEEAVEAGVEIVDLLVTPRSLSAPRTARVVRRAEAGGAVVRQVLERLLESLSPAEASQGVVALGRRPAFQEADLFRATPLILVAVSIGNPGNLGGLLRTAEAAGATGAYLSAGTTDAFGWKALRGSMGSAFRLPRVAGLAIEEVLARLAARGVTRVASVASGGTPPAELDLRGPVALLFGSEGGGLPTPVAAAADARATIPLRAPVESLNVGVAAGVLFFEAARQRGPSAG